MRPPISRSRLDADFASSFKERRDQLRAIAAKAGPEESADLIQESFLKAVEADRRTPIEKPLHFLRRVAHNLVVDRLRSASRARGVFSSADADDVADQGPGPERALLASQRLARAIAIIDRMPDRRREVFLLHRVEELTLAQCAKKLDISIKTVEKHMTQAMAQLAREIDQD